MTLPGTPGTKLQSIWIQLSPEEREALLPHLLGDTGAAWVAKTLTDCGYPIGQTSIKDYRRTVREAGAAA